MTAILTPVLELGPFSFVGFEEPSEVVFGKQQSNYTHNLIGGGKVVDLMGAADVDITWNGYFTGFQAEFRARYLETLCKQGQPLNLRTADFIKEVVITKFTYGWHEVFPVRYSITLTVIQDLTLPVTIIVPPDLTAEISAALIQAQDIASFINNPSVTNSLALALTALQAAAPLSGATNTAIAAALGYAINAQEVVSAAINSTQTSIFG